MRFTGTIVRRRALWSAFGLLLVAGSMFMACSKTGPDDGAAATMERYDNLRGMQYCEVFLIGGNPLTKALHAIFYNTTDLNNENPLDTCPAPLWEKVDAEALKKEYDVLKVFKNGPRGWTMDWIELPSGTIRNFNGLQARWMGKVELPKNVEVGKEGGTAYKPTQVHRESTMTFEAGKPVFILDDPNGTPWVMQAYARIVDPDLTYEGLMKLGDRLEPPEGWSYRVANLDRELTILAVDGIAHIMQDELQDTYDECFEVGGQAACSFTP